MSETRDGAGTAWPVYSVYGLNVASQLTFRSGLVAGRGPVDVSFEVVDTAPHGPDWQSEEPAYGSVVLLEDGESFLFLYRCFGLDVLRYRGFADFYLWDDRIVCHLIDSNRFDAVELYFLGLVLAFWLERAGTVTLHASAVEIDGKAVGFLASKMGGKSSLAATFVQADFSFLTDDFLALRFEEDVWWTSSGFPQMRMWPDQARHFTDDVDALALVLAGEEKRRVPIAAEAFCSGRNPLAALYIPERGAETAGQIEIDTLSPRDAVIELVRESFLTRLLESAGLHGRRLAAFVSLARQVPVRRIRYPNGIDLLPDVRAAIVREET
ncbi:MAG: hypothetical protein ABFS14_07925 [Gemmatimonadota bacterium]